MEDDNMVDKLLQVLKEKAALKGGGSSDEGLDSDGSISSDGE